MKLFIFENLTNRLPAVMTAESQNSLLLLMAKSLNSAYSLIQRIAAPHINYNREFLFQLFSENVLVTDTTDRGQPACHEDPKK
jgi:hypothetical protein